MWKRYIFIRILWLTKSSKEQHFCLVFLVQHLNRRLVWYRSCCSSMILLNYIVWHKYETKTHTGSFLPQYLSAVYRLHHHAVMCRMLLSPNFWTVVYVDITSFSCKCPRFGQAESGQLMAVSKPSFMRISTYCFRHFKRIIRQKLS